MASSEAKQESMTFDGKEVLRTIPMSGVLKAMANKMDASFKNSAQASMFKRVDMSGLVKLKGKFKAQGHQVTYTDLMIKVTALALEKNPQLNSFRDEKKLILYKTINMGVAVSTEDDLLIVPVIKNVEKKNLLEISVELKELVEKVREKRIQYEDISGGTFTFSNLGMFDMDWFTPILNYPETGILALGSIRNEAWVEEANNDIVVKPVAYLSFTGDHMNASGTQVAKFILSILDILKGPEKYLTL